MTNLLEKWRPDDILSDPFEGDDINELLDIKYQREPAGQDVWQLPTDTITRGCGDCEDLSILALKIWMNMGVLLPDLCMLLGESRGRIREPHCVAMRGKNTYYDCRAISKADRVSQGIVMFEPWNVFDFDRECPVKVCTKSL